ncbi:hypothetical protein F5890DRAFT_1558744 [Lentinula detonsa]|uniref:Uncharacterized protein n=1 Tax=Lentinula detonsa TaxID=2804962 RepID=A0AA38PQI9_9AGAR|nr:hypothetical protein F5890DRAFT_1558744 [Lentinula detonsa]
MSTTSNDSETIQQRRERILQAQAAQQRAREEEVARQEAEFAAEMERIEAEEKAAREAEEKRKAEEQRIEEEKRREEERKRAEEKKMAEEQVKKQKELAEKKRKEDERLMEKKRREEERVTMEAAAGAEDEQERTTAFTKLVAENTMEKERELERQQKATAKPSRVNVEIPVSTSSPRQRTFKSKAIISEDSSDEVVEQPREVIPRGTKRKRMIKMIAKGGDNYDPQEEKSDKDISSPPDLSQPPPTCSRCVMIGRPSECCPQSSRRQAQACAVCHQQRQRCSWSGDNAARWSQGKKVKLDDEVYEGPAARVGGRRIEEPGVAEQLTIIAGQNKDLLEIACRSLVIQEKLLGIMARREKREIDATEGSENEKEENEDEDEDGEGEEDEEEVAETKRKEEIREGKKRAE